MPLSATIVSCAWDNALHPYSPTIYPRPTAEGVGCFVGAHELVLASVDFPDLAPLAPLKNLERLSLTNTGLKSLDGAEKLKQLRFLTVNHSSVGDLKALAKLPLVGLSLNGSDVVDLSPLSDSVDIRYLALRWSEVVNLSPVLELTKLSVLRLEGTRVRDLRALRAALGLETLHAGYSQVTDLRGLESHPKLRVVDLEASLVQSVSPLAENIALEYLSLAFTKLASLRPLSDLKNLKTLDLRGVPASDFEELASLTELEQLLVSQLSENKLKVLKATNPSLQVHIVSDPDAPIDHIRKWDHGLPEEFLGHR